MIAAHDSPQLHLACPAQIGGTGRPPPVDRPRLGLLRRERDVEQFLVLLAGLPVEVAALTVNRLCASGLDAVIAAYRAIAVGEGQVYLAGGVESMTRAPYVLGKSQTAFDRNQQIYDTTLGYRFPNPRLEAMFPLEPMGETAENIYEQSGISRERQDAFALESQRRAVAAINAGRLGPKTPPAGCP